MQSVAYSDMITAVHRVNRQTLLLGTQILVVASVMLVTLSPFSAPVLVVGAFAVQTIWLQHDHGDLWAVLRAAVITRGWIALAVFIGYLALRLFPDVETDALPGLVSMAAFTALTFGVFSLSERQNEDVQTAIAQAFLLGFGIAAALHLFELLSGFALRRLLWTWVPLFRPRLGKIDVDGGSVRVLVPYIANQSSALLAALLWPVMLLGTLVARPRWQRLSIWLTVAMAVGAIGLSDQATSKMAVILGAAIWLAASLLPRATRPLLIALWLASTLLVLPAALLAYRGEAYDAPLSFSAKHRVVIWGVTAEKALEHPIVGIGTGRTAALDESLSPMVKYAAGTTLPIATNRHAHNIFLQTWYETGAIGAILLLLAGLPVIAWIAGAPPRTQPLLAAAFASAVMSASFSYSLLAAWFLATFAITALFCRFAVTVASTHNSEPDA